VSSANRLFTSALIFAGCAFTQDDPRPWMTKGIDAYWHGRKDEAIECFEQVVKLDPMSAAARISLGVAYLGGRPGWDPSGDLSVNIEEENFVKALDIDPQNKIALGYLALLYYGEAQARGSQSEAIEKLSDVESLYRRIVDIDPNCKEAFYMLGLITWCNTFHIMSTRLIPLGMSTESRKPLADAVVRHTLAASVGAQIADGIRQVSRAPELDNNYADAMIYLSHFLRQKATLSDKKKAASEYV
jgi:tetratricopeptide (TPR) repeat protein